MDQAETLLETAPHELANDPAIERARSAISLARSFAPATDMGAIEARIAADTDDHQARFELSSARMAAGDRDGAADALLDIISRDRGWEDGKARNQLLAIFDVVGLEDPWVLAQRRRLSAILFA